jgi:hypothetical protein
MSGNRKELVNSPRQQRAGETRTHSFTLPDGVTPSAAAFTVVNISSGATHSSGSGTISGSTVTLGGISGLTAGTWYRVDVSLTVGAETLIPFFRLEATA